MNKSIKLILLNIILFIGIIGAGAKAYAAPIILYTDILSGPNTGGENNKGIYLSIFGLGLGTTQGTSKVYINNTEVAAYKYWGSRQYGGRPDIQQITVQPGPAVTSGPIKVVVGGTSSNTDKTFAINTGDIYFIANDNPTNGPPGNDATGVIGDINHPFRHVQSTGDRSDFGPGDFIVMRGGTWNDVGTGNRFMRINKSGTAQNPQTFMGYPGETVTIDLSTNAPNTTWAVYQIDIIGTNIVDLAIDKGISNAGGTIGVGNDGLWTTTRLVNLDIYHGGCGTGFSQTPLEVDDVVNLKIYGLSVHDTNKCHDDNKHHMLYLAASADTVDIGWIDLHDQGVPGSYPLQYNDDPNPGLTRINNVDFHDSYIRNTARGMVFARGTGMGFRVFNNIFYNTGLDENANYSGIAFKNTFTQALIYNNTFYAQDPLANGAFDFQFATSIVVKNNIIQSSSSSEPYWRDEGIDPSVISASNNLWYGSNQAVPSWDTHPITANPLMVDPTNPARNFHLTSGSPAINAGVSAFVAWDFDEVLRPQGPAPDIGAFEYCASNCSVNDTTPPAKPTGLTVK